MVWPVLPRLRKVERLCTIFTVPATGAERPTDRTYEDDRIVTLQLEEHRARHSAQSKRQGKTGCSTDESHPANLLKDERLDTTGIGTQCHPETDLSRALGHGVCQDTIESDCRQLALRALRIRPRAR